MSKHTPGPWHVSELNAAGNFDPYSIFIEPNIAVIERKVVGQDQNDMADARLIAAAPDLLEAAEHILAILDHPTRSVSILDADKLRAAITKATA